MYEILVALLFDISYCTAAKCKQELQQQALGRTATNGMRLLGSTTKGENQLIKFEAYFMFYFMVYPEKYTWKNDYVSGIFC